MAGAGGEDDAPSRPRVQKASGVVRRRSHQAASLPLDVIAEIAARTDPATLVRCAATCGDLRGRVADPGFRRRLRLRHADRFVPSLLRGHLVGEPEYSFRMQGDKDPRGMYLVDATGRLLRVAESFPPGPDGEPLKLYVPTSSTCEGLVLVHDHGLYVCNLATGRSQAVPPGSNKFRGYYVLLVGDGSGGGGAVGRPFQVVKASLLFLDNKPKHVVVQTFSSELGAWGSCTKILTPQIQGYNSRTCRTLVLDGAMYWLCLTSSAGYVLKLRVRAAAAETPRLTVTKLPDKFPYHCRWRIHHLLATMAPGGGSPAVLVADGEKISAWTQSKHTAKWNPKPEVVIEYQAILRSVGDDRHNLCHINPVLVWFAERSGIVLIRACGDDSCFWLDLQSKKIVRWSSDSEIKHRTVYYPCEMDLSTWVPTFSSTTIV